VANEVVRKLPSEIPIDHCSSSDTRIWWLWNQRLAVIQSIFARTKDLETRMACSLMLTAAMTGDLGAIELVFQRIEGAPVPDEVVVEGQSMPL